MSGLVFCLGIFSITKSNIYITSTTLLIVQLSKLRTEDHPIYHFLRNDLSSINEELGEMTYSVLSNASLKLRDVGAHTAIDHAYRLMSTYREIVNGLKLDMSHWMKHSSHVSIIGDPALPIMTSFLKAHALEVSAGGFLPYHESYKKKNIPWLVRVRRAARYPDMGELRGASHTEVVAHDAVLRLRKTLMKMTEPMPVEPETVRDDRSSSFDSD